jgi:hypothetical protein
MKNSDAPALKREAEEDWEEDGEEEAIQIALADADNAKVRVLPFKEVVKLSTRRAAPSPLLDRVCQSLP